MRPKHAFLIVLLSAVWGVSFLMMRIAIPTFPPVWISMLRCALGASLMWTVLLIGGYRLPPRRLAPWLLLIALLNNAMPFTFYAWGEVTVPSNIAAVLNATVPIWTLLFSVMAGHAQPRPRTIAGVLLAFAGVLLVVTMHPRTAAPPGLPGGVHDGGESLLFGLIIIALASVSYSLAFLVAKSKLQGLDPMGLATTQLTLASLMLLPVALLGAHPSQLHAAPIAAVAVLGFAGSGIAYLLYYRLLQEITPTQLSGVTYLMPLWGLFWGLFAHEVIGLYACVGVTITIVGLVLMNLRERVAATAPAPSAPIAERSGGHGNYSS